VSSRPSDSAAPISVSGNVVVFAKYTMVTAITSPLPRLSMRLAVMKRPFPEKSGRPHFVRATCHRVVMS